MYVLQIRLNEDRRTYFEQSKLANLLNQASNDIIQLAQLPVGQERDCIWGSYKLVKVCSLCGHTVSTSEEACSACKEQFS